MKISKIIFYDEPQVPEINLDNLITFAENFGLKAQRRKSILNFGKPQTLAAIAASRVFKLDAPYVRHIPTHKQIKFEEKNIDVANPNVVCYDGIELQNVFGHVIPKKELTQDIFHVIFTDKLCCTYDDADNRYHARAVIGSNPSIISTTGIIEAPAKPREYYLELITNSRLGTSVDSLKQKYADTCLEYHDARLATIVEGYFLQVLLYYVSGEAFCNDRNCRIFNAHWQKDLLHSQLGVGKLCDKHSRMLESIRGKTDE